jgi:hypothetical protein
MTSVAAPDYLSTAFYSQYNLILLGGSALFSLASASPMPLAIGVAVEVLWLSLGPRVPQFRRHVDHRLEAEKRARLDDEVMLGMRGLSAEPSARLLALGQTISWIALQAEGTAMRASERATLLELEEARPAFLKLCKLHERLLQRLEEMRLSPPEQEASQLSQAYAAEKDLGLRFTLHQGIKLAQRKIEQQARLVDLKRQLELKLSLLEQSLAHLRSQQQLGAPAADLARDVPGILAHGAAAAALEAELAEA